jgi:hypothetical protein
MNAVFAGLCATLSVLLLTAPVAVPDIRLVAQAGGEQVTLSRAELPASFDDAASALAAALEWRPVRPGLDHAEIRLAAGGLRIPVRAILARIDPSLYRLTLELATEPNRMTGTWHIADAAPDAALAVNAGQFLETGPWGWVVLAGREHRDPGRGPLAIAVAVDTAGRIQWIRDADVLRAARAERATGRGAIAWAFQSYPLLLHGGQVPALARDRSAVSHEHRDARLVLAELHDGSLLLVLTRYGALGGVAERAPIGLTLPETVLLVGALGARHAVMLDGGVSAQLLLRAPDGTTQSWRGLRRVPLGLVATPRD